MQTLQPTKEKNKNKEQSFGGFRNKDASRTTTWPNSPNFGPKVTDPHRLFLGENPQNHILRK